MGDYGRTQRNYLTQTGSQAYKQNGMQQEGAGEERPRWRGLRRRSLGGREWKSMFKEGGKGGVAGALGLQGHEKDECKKRTCQCRRHGAHHACPSIPQAVGNGPCISSKANSIRVRAAKCGASAKPGPRRRFCKWHFVGLQPRLFIDEASLAALVLRWRSRVVETDRVPSHPQH